MSFARAYGRQILRGSSTVSSSARRPYSFFSSKSGAGRYISATKPPKVAAASAQGPQQLDSNGAPVAAAPDELEPSSTSTTTSASTTKTKTPANSSASAAAPPKPPHPHPHPQLNAAPMPPPHETLSADDVRLHAFFAHGRPLLLLPLPATSIFSAPSSAPAPSPPAPATVHIDGPHLPDNPPEATPETDADAARLLSRTLVMHRVGAWADWHRVLEELGDASAQVQLDSTRRKKRKKMKKHKLQKRRRLLRKNGKTPTK